MRVLVDTSAWSLALRRDARHDHTSARTLADLISAEEDLFVTGIVLQEVLQGYRAELEARRVAAYLSSVALLELDRLVFVQAADLFRRCAASDLGASTVDCQIAAAAIRYDCKLLTADSDFERIAEVSSLELLR